MKVLVLVSCLALASGQWAPAYHGSQAPAGYHGPHHVPVIKDGVPVETPEVQHAKAAHLAALAEASSRPGYQQHDDSQNYEQPQYSQQQYSQPQYSQPQYTQPQYSGYSGAQHGFSYNNQHQPQAYNAPVHAAPQHRAISPAYETSHAYPGVTNEGKPLDTPEVEAARAHHFALVNEALVRNAPKGGYQAEPTYSQGGYNAPHYRKRRGLYTPHIPIIHNGVPVEPLEVQQAREAHLAAHYGAGHHGYSTHQVHAPVYGHHDAYAHFIPSYGHDGHPLDTPEVEHAKAAHFAAHHEAAARNHVAPFVGHYAHAYAHNGAPVDTPEVQHAKALHFAAHAAASHAHHY